VKCYIATPSGEYDKTKVVIYICDAFGLELENNPLLCDDYARNGYKVYAPDLFEGEPVSPDILDNPALQAKFDFRDWYSRHSSEHNVSRIIRVIDELKSQGVKRVAVSGYCYGGRVVFDLSYKGYTDVVVTSHPSILEVADLEKYASTVTVPLLINACEIDHQFPKEKQEKARELFADFKPGFRQEYFEGCTHGFAVRGDLSDPKVKAGKEGAFKNTIEWFREHL